MGFSDRLAALRKEAGISQVDLAATLGVKQATISRWETEDHSRPSIAKLQEIAEAVGSTVEDLVGDGDIQPPNNIRALRLERGLTIQQLADAVGTSNQQIQRLETGARRLTDVWMKRVAKALGIERAALMSAEEDAGFAARFKEALAASGITQSELARRVGATPTAINHIAEGISQRSRFTAQIAIELGVDPYWLATGKDPAKSETESAGRVRGEILQLCRASKLAPSALAKRAGVAASTLNRFLNDPDHDCLLSTTTLDKLRAVSSAARADDVEIGLSRPERVAALDLPEGTATLHLPSNLSPESIDDLEAWIGVVLRAMRRKTT